MSVRRPPTPDQGRPSDVRDDALRHVDSRSRPGGATAFPRPRSIDASAGTARALTADRERLFTDRMRAYGVDAYPGTSRPPRALGLRRHRADIVPPGLGELVAQGASK
ncbi:hypothetical protein [Streptomyces pseudovenezuelae]|uniref:Uncharacterized protein n=1 Tax=Streptomyces pseudovenezuelae TaxID=67350 RepID=A0ABZ1XB18_9ACTN|nr:hypothetical protein [Streptomyces pseudovenezuelae]